jgi:hypothetical protein
MGFFVGGVLFPVEPWAPPTTTLCTTHLSELAKRYFEAACRGRIDRTLHGSAQILSWFGEDGPASGRESVFFCPGDRDAAPPETDEERSAYHPADTAVLRAARGLGSYAVRDFERCPIEDCAKNPILCDRQGAGGRTMHHDDVIVIAFDMGDAQTFTREQLGIAPGEPIVVGPDSPCPFLRVFERP